MKKILFLLSLIFLQSCFTGSTKNSNFYTLKSIELNNSFINKKVLINNVKLAEYIDRPQIITLKNNNVEYKIDEFNRWVEPLSVLIQKTIINDLKTSINIDKYNFGDDNFNYLVNINITRLDIELNKNINFEATIDILNKNKKVIKSINYKNIKKVKNNYVDVINQQSLIINELSQEIYNTILKINTK